MAALNTQSGVIIRQITDQDFDAYKSLRLEALQNHPTAFSADYEQQAAVTREQWVERLQQTNGAIFVAEVDSALIGMMGILQNIPPKRRHTGDIWGVYVRPQGRGQGIADALIEACVQWGRERGMSIVKLGAMANNAHAISCYLRCGFTIYGIEPAAVVWDGKIYDEMLMYRRI